MHKRVYAMFSIFTAEDSRENAYAEGFANFWEHVVDPSHDKDDWLKGIPASSSQTVLCKQLSGLLNQRKFLPIRFMPITIELPLICDHLYTIVSNMGRQGFAAANTSTTWQIMNVQAKCDLVTPDSCLYKSYIKLLEEGEKLALNYTTFISQYQTILNRTDFSINISRSLTRLEICICLNT